MTLFGRDSLLTSWMTLPADPSLACGVLETLARMQGNDTNRAIEEEPGKILHEVRPGGPGELALGGGDIYYGSIDATPLFVMLLGEAHRWGVDRERLARLDLSAVGYDAPKSGRTTEPSGPKPNPGL